jgi:hypothetical protein
MNGRLDRPSGALHVEIIDAAAPWAEMMTPPRMDRERVAEAQARHGLPCSHGAARGRAVRDFHDGRLGARA